MCSKYDVVVGHAGCEFHNSKGQVFRQISVISPNKITGTQRRMALSVPLRGRFLLVRVCEFWRSAIGELYDKR
jgi:hypothetical protein